MFPFVLALVDILADAFFTRISRRTGAIIIFLRLCTLILDNGDTCTIILSKLESCRTGTRVRSLEILTIVTAIVRRLVFALVLILTRVAVHVQRITRGTLASITRIYRYARMRARGIGARIDPRAGETIVLQDPSGRTRATIGRVLVVA